MSSAATVGGWTVRLWTLLPLDVPSPSPTASPAARVDPMGNNGFAGTILAAFVMIGLIMLTYALLNRRPR